MTIPDNGSRAERSLANDVERAVPDIDGEPAIADTLYAATEELEHGAPELRATADSIARVLGPLVHAVDAHALLLDDPDPASLLPDAEATELAGLLTDAADQADRLASVLTDAADQADGLAAVLTDDHVGDAHIGEQQSLDVEPERRNGDNRHR